MKVRSVDLSRVGAHVLLGRKTFEEASASFITWYDGALIDVEVRVVT